MMTEKEFKKAIENNLNLHKKQLNKLLNDINFCDIAIENNKEKIEEYESILYSVRDKLYSYSR